MDEDFLQLCVCDFVAQGLQPLPKGVLTGVLAQNHGILGNPNVGRGHNLIGGGVGQDAMLVNAALMGKGVGAHNGFVGRNGHAGNAGEELAGAVNLLGINPGLRLVIVLPGLEAHNNLLQAGVAGPLPDAVDGALHLGGAGPDAGHGVGYSQAQVIVAVDGDVHFIDARHVFFQVGNQVEHLFRGGVTDRVGDVQDGGTGFNRGGATLGQKSLVAAGSILGRELDVFTEGFGIGYIFPNAVENLFPGHFQLIFHVDVAGGQEYVNARVLRALHSVPSGVNVALCAAGETCHPAILHSLCNGFHTLEILGGGYGKACLDDVHAQAV